MPAPGGPGTTVVESAAGRGGRENENLMPSQADNPRVSPVTPDPSASRHDAHPPAMRVIEPRPGWRPVDLGEILEYRDLLYYLSWRDVKVRYKQTVLGATWAVLQPVLTMVVFSLVFGRLGRLDAQVGVPYPLFAYAGILPWVFFAGGVTQSSQSLIASSHLITRVYFPRLLIPFASVGAGLIDFAISCAVMLLLLLAYGIPPGPQLLLFPLLVAGTVLAALGIGTLLGALTVAYRDFRYVIPFLVQIWMFASPVAYPLSVVPDGWRWVYSLNPMAGLISGYRSVLLGQPFEWGPIAVSAVVVLSVFVFGTAYFNRVERRFADIV